MARQYTATQLAYAAARHLGCLRAGQTLSADILNDTLPVLNDMIDAFLLDKLLVFAQGRPDQFTLTAGVQFYLVGTGATPTVIGGVQYGAFNTIRPTQIENANIILNTVSPVVRTPLELIGADRWARLRVVSLPFAIPLMMYYDKALDPTTGFAVISLWPGPQVNYGYEHYAWNQLQQFADLTTSYKLAPGYAEAISWSLAERMAPMMQVYLKIRNPLTADVARQALAARANVMSYNTPETLLGVDGAYLGNGQGGAWNYAIGDYRR